MSMTVYAFAQLLVLVPAFLVVTLMELLRQHARERGKAFEGGLWILVGLAAAVALGSLVERYAWEGSRGLEESVCRSAISQRVLGLYGCYQLVTVARWVGGTARLIPVFYGLAGGLVLFWPGRAALARRSWALMAALLLVLIWMPPLLTGGRFSAMMLIFLVPILWIPLVWRAPEKGLWGWLVFGLALAGVIGSAWAYLYHYPMVLSDASQLFTLGLLPLTAGLLAAGAARKLAEEYREVRWLPVILHAAVALLAVGLVIYMVYNEAIWDSMLDGSGSILVQSVAMLGGVAGAMLLAWTLRGRRVMVVLIFGIAFLALVYLPPSLTGYPQPQAASTEIGLEIGRAVERYQVRTGQYPASLNRLVPRDLLVIRPPYVARELTWCYQSGADFYRLGYVYRPVAFVPPEFYEVRLVKSAGMLPEGSWECDEILARMQEAARGSIYQP